MIAIKGVDHLNMSVKNLEKSVDFYQGLFKNSEIKEEGVSGNGNPYLILGIDQKLYLCLYQNPEGSVCETKFAPVNHIGIHLENFDEAVKDLLKANYKLLYGGIVEYPSSKSVYISDPDGNELEFSSHFGGGLN